MRIEPITQSGGDGSGGGGLDPNGEEIITGDWLFDREQIRMGSGTKLALGLGADVSGETSNNVAIGHDAHAGNSGVSIGEQAGLGGSGGLSNTAVGRRALQNKSSIYSTAIGHSAGLNNIGDRQTAMGQHAGQDNSGEAQIVMGGLAGRNNTGDHQTAVGYQSGMNNTAEGPTSLGAGAGHSNSGLWQIAIGQSAGTANEGDRQIAIGSAAGAFNTGTDQIAIGFGAGRDNTRDYRLIIDNAEIDDGNLVDPLIDGRFRAGTDGDLFEYSKGVKINGHLETTDQLILHSPDGSRWAITVDDTGNLSTTPATEEITP